MLIELPEIDEILARLKTVEETIAVLQKGGKEQPKEWYNVADAASYLDCSSKTIYRLIERGLLKKSAGLRHIKITRQELEVYRKKTTT
jgi:excisionase family DNA binding protein